ncbi:uncharacterized protein SAPINGB_P005809 [Magnusiomyces paraingens]|uniref:Major facilitator superfamily (MFS) profile domain-containing protein n=1 Tax=Magnusiomyces paraingens TaxID=2606893 RepID=A0A5E8C8P9_9ASCO|nr:uncharacterized protein SAPINGB_P005809 [Saprochaete ingens]VVT57666.1 unnamed protein product [Saprochaete ingens]
MSHNSQKKDEDYILTSKQVDDVSSDDELANNVNKSKSIDPYIQTEEDYDNESGKKKGRHPFYGGKDHIFTDPVVADHYRELYEKSTYEGRNHFDPDFTWTPEQERKLLWKIEFRACFWACVMFLGLQLDRGNISQALSDNMLKDLGMTTNDYNTGMTIFYVVFLFAELPSQLISKKIGPDRWIPAQITLWSIVSVCQAKITGKSTFYATRALLGLLEGGFIADTVSWLSYFYTGTELPIRLSFFWTTLTLTQIGSSLLAFGVLRMRGIGGWAGWRWLFFLEGLFTLVIGLASFFQLPPSPVQTKTWFRPKGWFSEFEEKLIVNRVLRDDPSKGDMHNRQAISFKGLYESLMDYDIWPLYFIGLVAYIPMSTVSAYLTLTLKQLGFSTFNTNLLTIPPNVAHIGFLLLQTWMTEYFNERTLLCTIQPLWLIICSGVLAFWKDSLKNVWGTYAVLVVYLSSPYIHAILVGWCSRNSNTVRTRNVSSAVYNMFCQAGSIIASNIYRKKDAPYYRKGNRVLFALGWVSLAILFFTKAYYVWRNKSRDKIWDAMTIEEQHEYRNTTKDKGNKRLDFRFAH